MKSLTNLTNLVTHQGPLSVVVYFALATINVVAVFVFFATDVLTYGHHA